MAGLAAGSAVAGRFVSRVRRPVLWYGALELGIAASALAVPWGIRGATWLQTAMMGGRAAPPDAGEVSAAFFYVVAAFVVLVLPTGLMGATLPLLARHAVRSDEEVGRRVGTLYATNTLGAVVGTVLTGFLLLPSSACARPCTSGRRSTRSSSRRRRCSRASRGRRRRSRRTRAPSRRSASTGCC